MDAAGIASIGARCTCFVSNPVTSEFDDTVAHDEANPSFQRRL